MSEVPHPARNTANNTDPANTTEGGEPSNPDLGSNSVSAGASTSAKMKESMPSRVHPAHAAQNPFICAPVSGTRMAPACSIEAPLLRLAGACATAACYFTYNESFVA